MVNDNKVANGIGSLLVINKAGDIIIGRTDSSDIFADFSKLNIDEIFLGQVAFQSVTGSLNIADKLQYTLANDQLRLYNFKGALTVDKSQTSPAVFNGIVEGAEVNGGLLRVNVQ